MTQSIEVVYDRLVAEEKLKAGTKYERLAALVFKMLTASTTIHDLRLTGEVGVPHQVDVVVGDESKRVLIEAKDYDRKVSLPVVRDFSAVVADLEPEEAFVVSTVGFSENAQRWASDKGIKLAILRPPQDDEDWGQLLQRIDVSMRISAPADPKVTWFVDRSEAHRFQDGANPIGWRQIDDLGIGGVGEEPGPLREILEPEMQEQLTKLRAGTAGTLSGGQDFNEPRWLHMPGEEPLRVTGYEWTWEVVSGTHDFSVGFGVGGLAAELVLRTLDGEIHRIFSNRQIASWTFDGKQVVPRPGYS